MRTATSASAAAPIQASAPLAARTGPETWVRTATSSASVAEKKGSERQMFSSLSISRR